MKKQCYCMIIAKKAWSTDPCCVKPVPTKSSPGLWSSCASLHNCLPVVCMCPVTFSSETRFQSTAHYHHSYVSSQYQRSRVDTEKRPNIGEKVMWLHLTGFLAFASVYDNSGRI